MYTFVDNRKNAHSKVHCNLLTDCPLTTDKQPRNGLLLGIDRLTELQMTVYAGFLKPLLEVR